MNYTALKPPHSQSAWNFFLYTTLAEVVTIAMNTYGQLKEIVSQLVKHQNDGDFEKRKSFHMFVIAVKN